MTSDQERWAEALAIERWKGADAPVYVAERLGALALAGDKAGAPRFMEIAERLDQSTPRSSQFMEKAMTQVKSPQDLPETPLARLGAEMQDTARRTEAWLRRDALLPALDRNRTCRPAGSRPDRDPS